MVTAIADHTGGCLEALVLPQTASFTDVGLCYLLERSPALQSLSIASCSSVSDMAIMTLAKCCKRIQSLNVSRWVNHIRSFGCNVSVSPPAANNQGLRLRRLKKQNKNKSA